MDPLFVDPLLTQIDHLSPAALDELPHGAIQLDRSGTVLQFNDYESRLANLRKERVVGRNFFTEIAPCTNVKAFYGRFLRGVEDRKLHEKFRYHFAFAQNPRNVLVTLFYSDKTDTVWVFVRPTDT